MLIVWIGQKRNRLDSCSMSLYRAVEPCATSSTSPTKPAPPAIVRLLSPVQTSHPRSTTLLETTHQTQTSVTRYDAAGYGG